MNDKSLWKDNITHINIILQVFGPKFARVLEKNCIIIGINMPKEIENRLGINV